MAFATGLLIIDAPASALNNLGNIPGEREDNTVGVKSIRTKEGIFPYVSAQSFRYWHRMTLQEQVRGGRRRRFTAKRKSPTPIPTRFCTGTMISSATCARHRRKNRRK